VNDAALGASPFGDGVARDPVLGEFLEFNSPASLDHLSVAGQRHYMSLLSDMNAVRFGRPGPDVHAITRHGVPVEDGAVELQLYRPSGEANLPAHLFLHGGGWWHGSMRDLVNEAMCRERCVGAGVVVAAVEYRLAPEHPFPTGLNDAFASLGWLIDHAHELGIDPANVSVGGVSAGGNLAAALAHKVRSDGGCTPVLQLLEVPVLDLSLRTARSSPVAGIQDSLLRELETAVSRYLGSAVSAATFGDPLVSPLLAKDLSDLPPALVFTAEHDPLRTEGRVYVERLNAQRVPAQHIRQAGALHSSSILTAVWPPARGWHATTANALKMAHGRYG
jgi:acetyl esterase